MSQYLALRLRKLSMVYWVTKPEIDLSELQQVVVKTQNGTEVGQIVKITDKLPENCQDLDKFVNEIVRIVNDNDRKKLKELEEKEKDAFKQAREKIHEHKLNMKLLKAEYLFDSSRVIFYFKSENKVDFRELLKSLAAIFKTRIELRQIGVRDEAKLLGGIGCCGKEVCCHQFMNTFYPVSTKMAKEQNLSLNPAKLSGICGRLLCCLAHEYKYYASFHGKYPKISSEVVVGEETARVMDINFITQKLLLGFMDRRKVSYDLSVMHGRKDSATGRNLWWIQEPGEEEPDLSILLRNLNPPGSGKNKKKSQPGTNNRDKNKDKDKGNRRQDSNRKNAEEKPADKADTKQDKNEKNENDKKKSDSPTKDNNS